MSGLGGIPMVRCWLDGAAGEASALRYVPLGEFGLWRHLMESRHGRPVLVDAVAVWVAEQAALWNSGYAADELEPVLRVCYEQPGPSGVPIPLERFFPAETYPRAQEALLAHFDPPRRPRPVQAVAGYFVRSRAHAVA